jgi:hypothetical protein
LNPATERTSLGMEMWEIYEQEHKKWREENE